MPGVGVPFRIPGRDTNVLGEYEWFIKREMKSSDHF